MCSSSWHCAAAAAAAPSPLPSPTVPAAVGRGETSMHRSGVSMQQHYSPALQLAESEATI
jgi:hypothetical protein